MSEPTTHHAASRTWLGRRAEALGAVETMVLEAARSRSVISRDVGLAHADRLTLGQRIADRVAVVGGSWSFILGFCACLAVWATPNSLVLARPFDPYPSIFLNLLLSMLAAIQAPIIMMSQNRQAQRDRLDASHDDEVNLKAEIEIMALHEKLDALRAAHEAAQQRRIEILTRLAEGRVSPAP